MTEVRPETVPAPLLQGSPVPLSLLLHRETICERLGRGQLKGCFRSKATERRIRLDVPPGRGDTARTAAGNLVAVARALVEPSLTPQRTPRPQEGRADATTAKPAGPV
jgi:hypothetical protein